MVLCMRWVSTTGAPFIQRSCRNQTHPICAKYVLRPKSTASSRQKQKRNQQTEQKAAVPSQRPQAVSEQSSIVSRNTSKETPLVLRKPQTSPLPLSIPENTTGPISKQDYEHEPKSSGVYAPRVRLTVGVILIGSIIYSMLTAPLQVTEAPQSLEAGKISTRESGLTSNSPIRLRMEAFIQSQQSQIVSTLESLDPGHKFRTDTWTRPTGGGGISCVLQGGNVFEKAGVNTSIVYGTLPRSAIQKMRVNHKALDPNVESLKFFAAGLSLVLHPQNPMAPTVHLNYRYFETMNEDGTRNAWWFGGGTDLTPSYIFPEDANHFHKKIKETCDKHDRSYYPRFKAWCDKYFRIPHRGESRGLGGIFFDDLDGEEKDAEEIFAFVEDCAAAFLPSYLPIIQRRMNMPFTEKQKEWQQLRRGRYVEFNLINDRGTQFGLTTPNARVESILMSLPLTAKWMYMHEPEKGSWEDKLLSVLREPVEWV